MVSWLVFLYHCISAVLQPKSWKLQRGHIQSEIALLYHEMGWSSVKLITHMSIASAQSQESSNEDSAELFSLHSEKEGVNRNFASLIFPIETRFYLLIQKNVFKRLSTPSYSLVRDHTTGQTRFSEAPKFCSIFCTII